MSDQETADFSQQQENCGIVSNALDLLAMLHLNAGGHQPTTTTIATQLLPLPSLDQPTKYGSTKRQSPSSLSPQEPPSKRASTAVSPAAPTFSGDHCVHGFTKLPFPPALCRSISEPINSSGSKNPSDQSQAQNCVGNSVVTSPFQPLYRSISDPTSGSYPLLTTATSPRPPVAARKVMRSPSIGESGLNLKEESPTNKRLKRMKDRVREMSQWWNEVIKESEEDSDSEDNNDNLSKEESESEVTENEGPCQESVWVERNGGCLVLHFKCPCSKGYQIVLNGKNCYYKLTTF
ncbi:hypothetical protein ACH5RR_031623 [Cinchona calisaya]|uniref:Uncharacterized protein n=1 Tax=Cinchona calisaya TaxID=153742 RepID=A0ABD2YFS8_9GENT